MDKKLFEKKEKWAKAFEFKLPEESTEYETLQDVYNFFLTYKWGDKIDIFIKLEYYKKSSLHETPIEAVSYFSIVYNADRNRIFISNNGVFFAAIQLFTDSFYQLTIYKNEKAHQDFPDFSMLFLHLHDAFEYMFFVFKRMNFNIGMRRVWEIEERKRKEQEAKE